MRRTIARGRVFPQSYSTDRRYGRLSLKACALFPLMWANADDQGRLSGEPEEVKYACCPNIDHISKADIPALLEELDKNNLAKVYPTSKTQATQMLDWWEVQRLQWAYPSEYPPPEGWTDHLRFHPTPTEIITENWPPPGRLPSELLPSKLPSKPASALPNALPSTLQSSPASAEPHEELGWEIRSTLMALPQTIDRLVEHEAIKDALAKLGEKKELVPKSEVTTAMGRIDLLWEAPTGEIVAGFEIDVYEPRKRSLIKLKALNCPYPFVILRSNPEPLQWGQGVVFIGLSKERESSKEKEIEKEKEEGSRRGRGRLPSALGSRSPPSPTDLSTDEIEILHRLTECFKREWGRVKAEAPEKIIPREPTARESAQLRDLAKEISSAGGCPLDYINQAFRDAAGRPDKMHVSYVAAILRKWLGMPRAPPR